MTPKPAWSEFQVRIESDPKEWPAEAARLVAQRAQHEAMQATQKQVCCFLHCDAASKPLLKDTSLQIAQLSVLLEPVEHIGRISTYAVQTMCGKYMYYIWYEIMTHIHTVYMLQDSYIWPDSP